MGVEQLWIRRAGNQLTNDAYHKMDRLRGALRRHATAVYESLKRGDDDDDQKTARRLLVELTQLGESLRHKGEVWAAAFSPDGKTVVTVSDDNTARLWEAASGKQRGEPLRHEGSVQAAALSPDGRTVGTGSADNTARLCDAASAKQLAEPLRHEGEISAVAFSPDGKTVVTASMDQTARVWDVRCFSADDQPVLAELGELVGGFVL